MIDRDRLELRRHLLSRHVDAGRVPGLAALISVDGDVHVETMGVRDLDTKEPFTRDTIVRLASLTKAVVAAATMALVEDGSLRLDDPVAELLPELAVMRVLKTPGSPLDETVPAERPITVRHLLACTWGFGVLPGADLPVNRAAAEAGIANVARPDGIDGDEWLARLSALPLMRQPGETWLYNTGYDVLGVLIARASGRAMPDYLRERILDPLGMRDTGFHAPAERLCTAYEPGPEGAVAYERPDGRFSRPPDFPGGAGGLVSTVDDFHAFARMLMTGGAGVLSRASTELMTIDQLTTAQKEGAGLVPGMFDHTGWGFGMGVVHRRFDYPVKPGGYGWDGGLGPTWVSDPAEGLIALIFHQLSFAEGRPAVNGDFLTWTYQGLT